MNVITDTWRGLVRRKLWPVALLLVAALVAVPLTLAKQPEPEPVPANAVGKADEGLPATYVVAAGAEAESGEEGTEKRRRTLGDSKDPFEPAPLPKEKKKAKKKATSAKAKAKDSDTTSTSTDKQDSSSGSSSGGGTVAPTAPAATPTPTATPTPAPANSIRVRFSKVEESAADAEEAPATTVQKLDALPDETNPVLAFHGLEKNGKIAVFELTGNVTVEGDGECKPTLEDCQYLKLRAGETAFITVADSGEDTDGQYQLDLVKINARATASASSTLKKNSGDEAALRSFKIVR